MNLIQKKVIDIKQNSAKLTHIGEFCFFGYYGIMVILKTFGYVSYEKFYQLAFILALAFLAIKVLTTKYTMREFLILYLLLGVSAMCWLRVGEKNIMLITLTLWGIKNVDLRELIKGTIGIRLLGTTLTILFACVGIFDIQKSMDMATDYSTFSVYALGYTKPNTTFYIIFLTLTLILYLNYDKLNFWYFIVSMAICYTAFKATYCRTGMIVFCGMWALIIIDKLLKKKRIYKLLCFQVPLFFMVSIAAMAFYQRANPIWFKINRIFNGRIEISNNYHKRYGVTLFPKPAQIFWDMNATTMDNFYIYLFVSCGVIVALGFVYFATKAQLRLYEQGKTQEILFFTVFMVYALLEQGPFNPVLNPFILLLGNLIYRDFKVGENYFGKEEIKNLTSA